MGELEQLSDYLGSLYELALQPEGWPRALQRLLPWVGGCAAVLLHRQRACASYPPWLMQQCCAGDRLDWAMIDDPQHEPLLQWARQARGLPAGALLALSDIPRAARQEGCRTPMLVRVPPLSDLLIAMIEHEPHGRSTELLIARDTSQGRWDEAARATLVLLMPHLRRLLRLSGALAGTRQQQGGVPQRALSAARPYAFTPAETRVLEALLEGRTIGSAARRLGIGAATVKTHLQHIFDKTDTRRQIDLIRLLSDPQRRRISLSSAACP